MNPGGYEPLSLSSGLSILFSLLCPEGSGIAAVYMALGGGGYFPLAGTPPAPFQRISPCAQREEARAGPSPGHTALPSWPLMAKSPSCFLWCSPRQVLSVMDAQAADSVGHTWEALWWQLGLRSVPLPPPETSSHLPAHVRCRDQTVSLPAMQGCLFQGGIDYTTFSAFFVGDLGGKGKGQVSPDLSPMRFAAPDGRHGQG